jgi:hypothetical protein
MPPPRALSTSDSHVVAVAIVAIVIVIVATVVIAPATTLAVSVAVAPIVVIAATVVIAPATTLAVSVIVAPIVVIIVVTTIAVLATMALTVSIVVSIVIVVTTIVAIAVAFAVIVAATMTEVVAVLEVCSERALPNPDRLLLVLVARRNVAHGHLDLALRVLALVVVGAHPSAGRSLGVSTALGIRCAIVAATKLAVFPDDVAQRLESIANRDAAIVVHVADRRRAVAGMESTSEDVQDIADGRCVTFATRLATVADAGDGCRSQGQGENCGECK